MKALGVGLGLFVASFFSTATLAEGESMADFFARSVEALTQTVSRSLDQEQGAEDPIHYDNWLFSNFQIRVRPKLGFAVPAMASLRLMPEVELMWERKTRHPEPQCSSDAGLE